MEVVEGELANLTEFAGIEGATSEIGLKAEENGGCDQTIDVREEAAEEQEL